MSATMSARQSGAKRTVMPLAFLKRGESGIVSAVNLDDDVRKKLILLGICQNCEITVSSESCGSVIVSIGGAHYALSRPTAMKIMVGVGGEESRNGNESKNTASDSGAFAIKDMTDSQNIGKITNIANVGAGNEIHDIKKAVGTI